LAGALDGLHEAARPRPGLDLDPAGTAGRLLTRLPDLTGHDPSAIRASRGGVISIPIVFTPAKVVAAARADPVLAEAAAAAAHSGQDGQIAQYLAGVPDLLDRYQGLGGNRHGQAVITAAMDAARLGCQNPVPGALLLDAGPGYLDPADRTLPLTAWKDDALAWATATLRGAVKGRSA
jgi:hypothetical protein